MSYWVTTESGFRIGPYENYAEAFFAATVNFGMEGWVISGTQ